jgi:hypothetical protein
LDEIFRDPDAEHMVSSFWNGSVQGAAEYYSAGPVRIDRHGGQYIRLNMIVENKRTGKIIGRFGLRELRWGFF